MRGTLTAGERNQDLAGSTNAYKIKVEKIERKMIEKNVATKAITTTPVYPCIVFFETGEGLVDEK